MGTIMFTIVRVPFMRRGLCAQGSASVSSLPLQLPGDDHGISVVPREALVSLPRVLPWAAAGSPNHEAIAYLAQAGA